MTTNGNLEKPVVLVVDDDKSTSELLKTKFEHEGHTVFVADSFDGALKIIHENGNTLMVGFIDIHLPGVKTGVDIIRYIKQVARHRIVPYSYTGDDSMLAHSAALEAGAIRAFIKSKDSEELMILYAQRSTVLQLIRETGEDEMTGLDNLRNFTGKAKSELSSARSRRQPEVLSLLIVDIDHFKSINETQGYLVGDEILRVTAKVLKKNLRPSDYLARKAGTADEFLLLLPFTCKKDAKKKGKELQKAVAAATVDGRGGEKFHFSISFGVGEIKFGEIGEDIEVSFRELINRADLGSEGLKAEREKVGHVSRR